MTDEQGSLEGDVPVISFSEPIASVKLSQPSEPVPNASLTLVIASASGSGLISAMSCPRHDGEFVNVSWEQKRKRGAPSMGTTPMRCLRVASQYGVL